MASSTTEIANFAIGHLGIGKRISDLDTERSAEALACRQFYENTRKQVLRDFPWPFATKFAELGLIEEDPTSEWSYSYEYPSDCLKVKRILSGLRNDTGQSRIPYRLIDERLILCDLEDAEIEYTKDVEDVTLFPSDFVMALSYLLAAYIAPQVTSGDKFKQKQEMMQMYAMEVSSARANMVNEEQPDQEVDSEFIRTRS